MGAYSETWEQTRSSILATHGKGASSSMGDYPAMLAAEPIVMMAPWTNSVRDYIIAHNRLGDVCPPASLAQGVEDESPAARADGLEDSVAKATGISIDEWFMQGVPDPSDPSSRAVNGTYYRPAWTHDHHNVGMNVVAKWQSGILVAARSVLIGMGSVARPMDANEVLAFWNATEDLADALDVAGETPSPSTWSSYLASVKTVLHIEGSMLKEGAAAGANLAGQAAHEIAATAGDVGNEFLKGFFGDLYPIALVGGAVVVAIKFKLV